jgi:hypothetical protein
MGRRRTAAMVVLVLHPSPIGEILDEGVLLPVCYGEKWRQPMRGGAN